MSPSQLHSAAVMSRPAAHKPGSSSSSQLPPKRIVKVIAKTEDLLRKKQGAKGKGKAKTLGPDEGFMKALPDNIQVERFAETRALEILAFQNAIRSAADQGSSRVFQSLPRHLRRRAASHNPRRVPKRLRAKASFEIAVGDDIAKKHRKKAKLRAKGNLHGESRTAQLLRRQKDKKWLASHLYHAKRFHMINLWGYRLPLTPTLKSFRPAYRASRRTAIVHDASYFGIVELKGKRNDLVALLSKITGGPFAGQKYEIGTRLVETTLYHAESYPYGLLGPAEILWRNGSNMLWIRLHPTIFQETWDVLQDLIGSNSTVEMKDLRDQLGCFELVGPQSGRILRRIIRVCKEDDRREVFKSLENPQTLPTGLVMAFKVYDPRMSFPPRSADLLDARRREDGVAQVNSVQPSVDLSSSGLWKQSSRSATPRFKKSDLDRRRRDLASPGTRLHPTTQDDRIEILIFALGDRFLLMFPGAWTMPILQSIVYTGTLIGGLEERRAQWREKGLPCFPEHFGSVCQAGEQWEVSRAREEEARWSRKPPGKRIEGLKWRPDWKTTLSLSEEDRVNGSSEPWLVPIRRAALDPLNDIRAFRQTRKFPERSIDASRAVLQVRVEMEGRGSPGLMAEILLPDQKTLIGYTTTGNFSLSRGHGFAIGLITLNGCNSLEEDKVAFVRDPGGDVLRRATLVPIGSE